MCRPATTIHWAPSGVSQEVPSGPYQLPAIRESPPCTAFFLSPPSRCWPRHRLPRPKCPGRCQSFYTDGTRQTLTDWHFTYYYGAGDQPFTGGPYLQLTKRTTESPSGNRRQHRERSPADGGAATPCKRPVRDPVLLGSRRGPASCWQDRRDPRRRTRAERDAPLRAARKSLSTKPFGFATSIWLHGKVLVNGTKAPFELRIASRQPTP
jgi:hypothetical protein